MSSAALTARDLESLRQRGISPEEAERQLAVLAAPAHWATLERPCTLGDGIEALSPARLDALLQRHTLAAKAGRVSAFVPASGAATRMFKDLLAARAAGVPAVPAQVKAAGDAASHAVAAFVEALPRFAFEPALAGVLRARGFSLDTLRRDGPWGELLDAFLAPAGLDAARAPKGLLAFHREAGEVHTAFEEHLVEAVALTSDSHGVRRLDVTVSPEHREGFAQQLAAAVPRLAARYGGNWEVVFGEQHPATDTLAGEPAGGPFRDADGALLFRPAGHGALLKNLAESGRDLVFLKNIDNVAVSRLRPETERWSRALVGLADELAEATSGMVQRLAREGDTAVPAARAFAAERLGLTLAEGADAAACRAALDRPVRVCGMVPNTGEPGGGPFWVKDASGVSRQIVESAQVDPASESQMRVLRLATHFNPVFLAGALRDAAGRAHALERFVDPAAVIVTRKSHEGRELLALERPGLWNGAMARWHTCFVEVPLAVFNPVKTVFDLLRPEHQGQG